MLYSKNGSIPKSSAESICLEGWIEVEPPPTAGEGQEVVWWYPPGWVVRPVKPAPVEGHCWSWSQSEGKWILCEDHNHVNTIGIALFEDATTIVGGNSNDVIDVSETNEQIAQYYTSMMNSVRLINSIILGQIQSDKETLQLNIGYLELMRSKDFWTNEDMTAIDLAIYAGKDYFEENYA